MTKHGVIGAPECVGCFERSCFGCALTAAPIGVCPICGRDIRINDDRCWLGEDLAHFDCMEAIEDE